VFGTLRCAQVFVDMVATKRLSLAPSISTFDRRFAGVAARHALRVARCPLRVVPLGVAGRAVLHVARCALQVASCTLSAVRRMMRVRSVATVSAAFAVPAGECSPADLGVTLDLVHRLFTTKLQALATFNTQHATCDVQHATCNLQRATRNMQLASALAATMQYFYSRACTPMAAD
jgi:hypothetical protein